MRYLLGVKGSKYYDLDKKKEDYSVKIVVSEEIYDFMNNHDVICEKDGRKVFKYNNIEYIDLGTYLAPNSSPEKFSNSEKFEMLKYNFESLEAGRISMEVFLKTHKTILKEF